MSNLINGSRAVGAARFTQQLLSAFAACSRFTPVFIVFLTGCALRVGPDYEAPDLPAVADSWQQSIGREFTEKSSPMHSWWEYLDDDVLSQLIQRAHDNNLSIEIAAARIAEARASLGISASALVPDLRAVGSATRQLGSEGVAPVPPPQTRIDTVRSLGFESSWELDLWGRVRRSIESSTASYESSIEDLRDTLVVTYADVASNYVSLRTLQERLRLAQANVVLQSDTLNIVRARNKSELAPDLELRQAELNLAVTQSAVPLIEANIAKTISRLSVLVGEPPHVLFSELVIFDSLPTLPPMLAFSLPADVIRQRPDIRSAERSLAAQTAQIGVAKAQLYPNFSLTGSFSFATAQGGVFQSEHQDWSFGPSFSWNLFNRGRVRNGIKVQEIRTEQALTAYEETVIFALQDVEDSIVSYTKEAERLAYLNKSVVAARQANTLVRELYRQGLTDFQNVLDTQRSLFTQEDSVAESQGNVLLNFISVYRAFGGGWAAFDSPTTKEQ